MYNEAEVYKIANDRLVTKVMLQKEDILHKTHILKEINDIVSNHTIEDSFKILVLKRLFKEEEAYENSKTRV